MSEKMPVSSRSAAAEVPGARPPRSILTAALRQGAFLWSGRRRSTRGRGRPGAPVPRRQHRPRKPRQPPVPAPEPGPQPSRCHNAPVITVSMPHCDGSRRAAATARPPPPGTPGTGAADATAGDPGTANPDGTQPGHRGGDPALTLTQGKERVSRDRACGH